MSREKELAKNTAILTIGKICTQFVSFLLLPLYTSILDPDDYGIHDLLTSYIFLLVPLFSLMLDQGLFRFVLDCRNDNDKIKSLVSTMTIINVVGIVVYIVLYFCIQRFVISRYKIYLLIGVVLHIVMNALMQLARGVGKTQLYAISSFISATSQVLLNIVLLVFLKMGAWGLFISSMVGSAIADIVLAIGLRIWEYIDIRKYSKDEARSLLKYSLPFIPNQLSWWAMGVSDKTVISLFINVTANGIYSVANKFSSIYITFYNIFNLSWTESVSLHINDDDTEDYLKRMINSLFSLFFSACFGIIAFMPYVFSVMINEKYAAAYPQIPILMVAVLFQTIVGSYSVVYVALKKSGEIAKTSFFAAIINIAVNISLVKWIDLYAASISTLVAYIVMTVYRYLDIKKYMNIPLCKKTMYICIGIFICGSYYINNQYLNAFTALATIVFAIASNKEFIKSAFEIAKIKFDLIFKH